jgi:putative flippase GtrA
MNRLFNPRQWIQFGRYYIAGIVNMAFGFGLYAVLVRAGLNIFVAQLISHLAGMAFNYFTYSRHVFQDSGPAKTRFLGAYAINYVLSVGSLAVLARFLASPYLAGLVSVIAVSLVNFFLLKHLVFKTPAAP